MAKLLSDKFLKQWYGTHEKKVVKPKTSRALSDILDEVKLVHEQLGKTDYFSEEHKELHDRYMALCDEFIAALQRDREMARN